MVLGNSSPFPLDLKAGTRNTIPGACLLQCRISGCGSGELWHRQPWGCPLASWDGFPLIIAGNGVVSMDQEENAALRGWGGGVSSQAARRSGSECFLGIPWYPGGGSCPELGFALGWGCAGDDLLTMWALEPGLNGNSGGWN